MVGAWPARVFAAAEPRLGTAANFAILAGSTITSTGNTVINGNLGLDPGTSVTGFGPRVITGTQHIHDATAAQAKSDLATAYGDAVAAPSTSNLTGQDLGGMTLPSGVYTFNSSAQLTGILTLSGTGVFIFQIGSTLTTAPNAAVVVAAGAQPCAVYWQVGSSATLDTGTQFQGNVMAQASITMNSDATIVTGRAMAQTAAVTLIKNTITTPTVPCVPTPPAADIGITKTVDNPTPNLGGNVTFTITATNHGPDNATGVQVTDLLPAGLTFLSATLSVGTYDSGTGVWTIGALANGISATLAITATVASTATLTNTATKTAEDQADPVSANNSATATVTALGADIGLAKTVDNPTPNLGSNVTFTITTTNHGPGDATGVQVTDLLPPDVAFVSALPSVGTYTSGTGAWNIGALANGASATLAIVATVTGTAALTNTATKTAEDQVDPVSGNNSATATLTALGADIGITKTVDNPTPRLGSNVTFTITATNHGPGTATGVQITDLLPAGLTFVSSVASAGTYDSGTGVWNIGALANGASATLSVTATASAIAAVTNTATKTAEDQADPVGGNNSASATVTPVSADIGLTKTVDNATPSLGSNVTFTITATNRGPSNATGVQVTDVLPAGLTYVSSVASAGTTYDSGTGIWNIGALANGLSATLSITATVTSTASVTNTASKTAEDQVDPVSGNNSASATLTALGADIGITKTVDNPTPRLGSNVTFTITATNHGPGTATGVQVTDLLPAGLTYVSSVASVGTYDSGTGVWIIGALANGASATLSVIAAATAIAAVTNTATKTAEDQADPVAGNNSASATVSPFSADIGLTKTVDNATPSLGSNVTFTITATNHGPSNATGVQVTDVLPAGLIYVSSIASAGTTYNSGTGIWNIGALANGLSATLSITATVTTTASVTNTANKTAEDQVDPVAGNNSASAVLTGQAADIGISKTVDNSTPNLGSNVTFTITATNHGPSNATGVQVTDVLPAGLTYVSSVASAGTYDSGTGIWTIGALANGLSATLSITAAVTSTAAVINTATKTAEVQPDLVPGNDSASVTVTGQAADIGVTKTVDKATPLLGSSVTFTITATNHGPSNATGVQLTDVLPAGLTYVSSVASVGTYDSGTGIWNIGALLNTASATLSITATATTTASVINTAAKSAEVQPDLVPGNDSASVTVTGQAADIGVTKTVDNSTPNLGSNVTFTITATNHGPSNATGVQVTDNLPGGLTYVSSLASAGTYDSGTGIWTIGTLANTASATLSITATVTSTAAVINTAAKTAEVQPDLVPANDSASVTVTGQSADVGVTKTVDNATPLLGSNVTFMITATNHGPSNATGVQLTDVLPAGLTYVSSLASAGTYDSGTGIWTIGALANTASATLSITATVTSTAAVINTATKTAEVQPDLVPANDSASVTVTGQAADIGVTKTVDNSTPLLGSNVTFTITATNHGPSNATGVQVTDVLPAGLTYVSSLASTGTYDPATGIWTVGSLTSGTNATLVIVATVTRTSSVINTAAKTAEIQPDLVPGNDSASVTVNGQAADIGVTKTVDNATPSLGSNVTFTITATNHGPSNATGVQVTDVLPAGLTYVSSVASAGTAYDSGTGVWNIGALANGLSATLTITATVTTTASVTNTANKTAEDQVDLVPGNDSASVTVNGQAADIGVTKTVDNSTPLLGSNVTFTITATNHGPSNATGVQVTDVLPAGLTYVSSVASAGTYDSGTGIWTIGALASTASATLSITATVTSTAAVVNTAAKTAEVQPDLVPGNDSASVTVTGQAADVAVTKTVDNSTPNLGSNVTFTITATNHGPSNATGVQVTDVLPAGLTYVSSLASAGTYDSGTGIWTVGSLTSGTNTTLAIVATVTRTSSVINTAAKTAELQPDLVPANDSASATVTGQAADIGVTKTVDNATPLLGSGVTFTITATNHGPSNATGVQVTDVLPAGLTYVSSVASAGTYDSGTGVWNIGALANTASATLAITATVTSTAAVINTAAKTAEVQPDLVPANDSASVPVTGQAADIGVTKTVDNSTPNLGSSVTFTITATNHGPSDATGVQVTDVLPAGLTYVSSLASAGTYDPATGIWTVGSLTSGTNATLVIVATVTRTTALINTAAKTAEVQPDSVPANNSASATLTPVAADIGLTKTVDNATPIVGTNVTFTITATNHGPSNATGVHVTDLLPLDLTYVSNVSSTGTYDSGTGVWTIGALANGSNATLSITATVIGTAPVTNTASKTAEVQPDQVPGNDSASVTVTGQPDPPGLPGLPNTSAPDVSSGEPMPNGPDKNTGLALALLAVAVAGLGLLGLAGIGLGRSRARVGARRSRRGQRRGSRAVVIALFAAVLSLAVSSFSAGELASHMSTHVVALAPGTQLIGAQVVSVTPPAAPGRQSLYRVAGPITPSRLRIPSIGVDSSVGAVGLLADGSMGVPDNLWTSSWLADGPRPGEPGNAVIAGHRGVGSPALFSHLENVQPGDRIYVSDRAGNELIYVVTGVAVLDLSPSTQVAVFKPTPTEQLVLVTCFGHYIPRDRTYDHRLVVFSVPLALS